MTRRIVSPGLASFVKNSLNKDPGTNFFRGTLFEWHTREALQSSLGMSLDHVGGRSDRGIDLRGTWPLSTTFPRLPSGLQPDILAQCKNVRRGCTPDHLRSLVGAIVGHTSDTNTIGLLSTPYHKPFTPLFLSAFSGSRVPLGLVQIEGITLKSLIFNEAAKQLLPGISVTTYYDPQGETRPALLYQDEILKVSL